MKLIDAYKINPSEIFVLRPMEQFDFNNAVQSLIYDQPTIDAVHAAGGCYCIECKYACNMGDNILYCNIIERDMMPDDYCSMGLQKENEHETD